MNERFSEEVNTDQDSDFSALRFANEVMRRRDLVVSLALAVFTAVVIVTLLRPREFTATASFFPQAPKAPSGLSNFAAQFGLALPTQDAQQSPAFYADLIKSREILGAVVDSSYRFGDDTTRALTLVGIYESPGDTPGRRRDAAIRQLRENVYAGEVNRTGLVDLRVTAKNAVLAERILQQILRQVNVFNLETRQTQAAAEREFTERRLREARNDLRLAEDSLTNFLIRNREYSNSPQLRFQYDRMSRELTMQQQIVNTLAQSYEHAKIEEVRDTPIITIVERPIVPVRPDPRGLVLKGLVALFVGALLAILIILFSEMFESSAPSEDELVDFHRLRQDTWSDLLHPWRPLTRVLSFRRPTPRRSA